VAAVAHRGDPYRYRENTLASVASALRAGADTVEVDVQLTRDGVPVLLHDPTLERLWEVPAPVGALTAAEVADRTGGGVPPLAAALAELAGAAGRGRMLLDLTEPAQAGPALAVVDRAGAGARVYWCGGVAAMAEVRALDPAAEIALTWKTSARPAQPLLDRLAPRWLNLRFPLAVPETVAWAHERGMLASAWTVDWERSMRRLVAAGVDGLTSNRLDALLRVLRRGAVPRPG
jgi:glycerophosphoryl diester phosphodiesterase